MTTNETLQELNATQNAVEDLLKELAAERKFRDEFEAWLDDDYKGTSDCPDTYPGSYGGGMLSQARSTIHKYNELKAQILGKSERAANELSE